MILSVSCGIGTARSLRTTPTIDLQMDTDGHRSKGDQEPLHSAAAEAIRPGFPRETAMTPCCWKTAFSECAQPRAQQRSTRQHAGKPGDRESTRLNSSHA